MNPAEIQTAFTPKLHRVTTGLESQGLRVVPKARD